MNVKQYQYFSIISRIMSSLPATIKALQVQKDKTDVKLVDIPLAARPDIKNIDSGFILLKVRALGLNPTDWKVHCRFSNSFQPHFLIVPLS